MDRANGQVSVDMLLSALGGICRPYEPSISIRDLVQTLFVDASLDTSKFYALCSDSITHLASLCGATSQPDYAILPAVANKTCRLLQLACFSLTLVRRGLLVRPGAAFDSLSRAASLGVTGIQSSSVVIGLKASVWIATGHLVQ